MRDYQFREEENQLPAGFRFEFFKTVAGPDETDYPPDATPKPTVYYCRKLENVSFSRTPGEQSLTYTETDQYRYLFNLQTDKYIEEGAVIAGFHKAGYWYTIDKVSADGNFYWGYQATALQQVRPAFFAARSPVAPVWNGDVAFPFVDLDLDPESKTVFVVNNSHATAAYRAGSKIWQDTNSSSDHIHAIAVTPDRYAWAVRHHPLTSGFSPPVEVWLDRLDCDGAVDRFLIWSGGTWSSPLYAPTSGIAIACSDRAGNLYVLNGNTNASTTIGVLPIQIRKYVAGVEVTGGGWPYVLPIASAYQFACLCMRCDPAGNIYLVGQSLVAVSSCLLSLSPTATVRWTADPSFRPFKGVDFDSDGNVYVAANPEGVWKYDTNGNLLWSTDPSPGKSAVAIVSDQSDPRIYAFLASGSTYPELWEFDAASGDATLRSSGAGMILPAGQTTIIPQPVWKTGRIGAFA